MSRSEAARLEATKRGVKFGVALTADQRRRYERRDGHLIINVEGRPGDDAVASVDHERSRD